MPESRFLSSKKKERQRETLERVLNQMTQTDQVMSLNLDRNNDTLQAARELFAAAKELIETETLKLQDQPIPKSRSNGFTFAKRALARFGYDVTHFTEKEGQK